MSKILITGANGFIGKRLVIELLELGHEVYALSRIRGVLIGNIQHPKLRVLWGDFQDLGKMDPFPQDIDAAYYLMHSMSENVKDLVKTEAQIAENFVKAIDQTSCKQIIYLGGIINGSGDLSLHLTSRQNVEEVLKTSNSSVTVLRSSIIIGAGSASLEIIRDSVEKLPLMITPKWVSNLCQPISIVDVLYYLTHSLLKEEMFGKTFDIGGPEVMSFKQVLLRYGKFRKLKRLIIEVPFLTPKLSSYWLAFVTSVRFSLCYFLVESMKHSSICQEPYIQTVLPHSPMTLEKALERTFLKLSQNQVASTWMDGWCINGNNPDIQGYTQIPKEGCLKDIKVVALKCSKEQAIERIWSIGGESGWYGLNWAWKIRGLIDKFAGGAGLNRGRRHPTEIDVGDSIDFWRVVKADKDLGHLILYAEMKLPGEAWLEFKVQNNTLHQIATFRPKGLLGRCYWYTMIPFHFVIFRKMAESLAAK